MYLRIIVVGIAAALLSILAIGLIAWRFDVRVLAGKPVVIPVFRADFSKSLAPESIGWSKSAKELDSLILTGMRRFEIVLPDGRVMSGTADIVQPWQSEGQVRRIDVYFPNASVDVAATEARALIGTWGLHRPTRLGTMSLDEWVARQKGLIHGRPDLFNAAWDGAGDESPEGLVINVGIRHSTEAEAPWTVMWSADWRPHSTKR